IKGEGTVLSGDSGAPLLVDGKIQGIATGSDVTKLNDAGDYAVGYRDDSGKSTSGRAFGLRLTADYKKLAEGWCMKYMASVPEPSSALLFSLGLMGLAWLSRLRQRGPR